MNDRYRNERNRGNEHDDRNYGRGRSESGGWQRPRSDDEGFRAHSAEPRYSSDEDETYGSEWDRETGSGTRGNYGSEGRGGYGRGNVGMYGGGSSGGYQGGSGSGGYGGGSGTDYSRGNIGRIGTDYSRGDFGGPSRQGQLGGGQRGYGSQGYGQGYGGQGYGGSQGRTPSSGFYAGAGFSGGREQGFGRERGFGGAGDQGYRGRDFGSPGADLRTGGFSGRGPKGYTRTDERIREDVCERLSRDDDVDASEIEVRVKDGEVTLEGSVITRSMKHHAENIAEDVSGVRDVTNNLKVVKGMLSELKDKLSGEEREQHFANGGTKNTPSGSISRAG